MTYSWQEYRYCPRCGTEYRVADFDAETVSLLCASCGYQFFQNSSPASTAVIPSRSRPHEVVLLTRATMPGKGLLGLPGGFSKYRESPGDAVRREVAEEILVDVEVDRLLDAYLVDYEFRGTLVSVVELAFVTKPLDVDVAAVRTGEASTAGYYDVRELRALTSRLAFPEQRQALERYCDSLTVGNHAVHH